MGIESDIYNLQTQVETIQEHLGIISENTAYRFKLYYNNMQESMFIGPTFETLSDAKTELQILIDDIKLKRRIIGRYLRKSEKEKVELEFNKSAFADRYNGYAAFDSSAYGELKIKDSENTVKAHTLHYIEFTAIELIKIVAVPDESTYYKF